MSIDPETRQRLLELVYGLLPEEEAAELRRRIESEPELAAAYTEAEKRSELFAEAARLQEPKVELSRPQGQAPSPPARPQSAAVPPPAAPHPPKHARTGGTAPSPWTRGANWTVAAAAAVLLVIAGSGYWYHRNQLAGIAAEHLRLQVSGPARLQESVDNRYQVTTTSITGRPVSAEIEFALYRPDGKTLLVKEKEKTDESGRLELVVPASLDVDSGARMVVAAVDVDKREEFDTRLAVEPVRWATQLSMDKPLYQPGETVRYRSLTLARFGMTADRAMPLAFEILDPGGAVVAESHYEGVTDRGVGCGEFPIPPGLAGGEYALVAKSLDGSFPDAKRAFFIRSYRLPRLKKELEFTRESYAPGDAVVADFSAEKAESGPAAGAALRIVATVDGQTIHEEDTQASQNGTFQVKFSLPDEIDRGAGQLLVVVDDGGTRETVAKTIPINLGKVDVAFYPEGGDLVAGLENRVYFTARNLQGEPIELKGQVVDSQDRPVADLRTKHEGMGAFTFEPQPGRTYKLRIESPAGVDSEPRLPAVSAETPVVLNTGLGVFEAGEPLEFNVRAVEDGLPMVAAAWCRGVLVGEKPFVTDGKTNQVAVDLDENAYGVIRLTLYDYTASPPEPVAERLVYRRPAKKLDVRVAGHEERYTPGEPVELSLVVTDESGEPSPAVLGVAVVDDALLNLADDDTPAMPTHFLLTSEVEKPEDLEDADFYLSDDPEAPVALDLLLGTQGWRRFVERSLRQLAAEGREDEELARLVALGGEAKPPAVFDNLEELQNRYQASLDAYRDNRTQVLNTLTTLSFFGGAGLLLLVAMLSLLNVASGLRVWVPAVAAAAACLLVGVVLMDPERLSPGGHDAVAFATFESPPEPASVSEQSASGREDEAGAAVDEMAQVDDAGAMLGLEEDKRQALEMADGEALRAAAPPAARFAAAGVDLPEVDMKDADADFLMDWQPLDDEIQRQLAVRKQRRLNRRVVEAKQDRAEKAEQALDQYRFPVRQYAHVHQPGQPGMRSDFAETLYWHPLLVAGSDGRATVQFDLCDSVTTFRVMVDAHDERGRIGAGSGELVSRIPFSLEPKLPLEVNAGDRIDLPLAVANDTRDKLPVEVVLEHGDLVQFEGDTKRTLELAAEARRREYFALEVTGEKGNCELVFRGTAGNLADSVSRPLRVVPPGFPKALSYSGRLDGEQEVVVKLPEEWVPGSLEVVLNVFPSTLADLQKGVEGILREPCGCFEQASTSNYPNVLSLQYMQEHDVADPDVTRRAKELLDRGYAKLTGYECPKKGYEWFGGDPGHEALTAYGLMEFRDMAEVYGVDPEMIQRTAEWLLARRDGKGGFERNPRALDSFGRAPEDITDAYITWALSESGQEGIDEEVEHTVALAKDSDDPYLIALAAGSALNAGRKADGRELLDKLAEAQADDGHLTGTRGSITQSGGQSLDVETTALAALAWLKLPDFADRANKAVQWITASRQGSGAFGSTQATILALKALVAHADANRRTTGDGTLVVKRDDAVVGEQAFSAGRQETISLEGLEAKLTPGENRLAITLTGDNQMPYALDVGYRTRKLESDDACPVRLSTELAAKKVAAGESVAMNVELSNTEGKGQPMTVAILGLPAGLEPRPDQLDELKKAGTIDYYETRAREVICYWRSLAPEKKVGFQLDLIAAVPGRYMGPASRAYLYYTPESKHWTDPLEVEIPRE